MTKEFCDICGRPIETYKNVSEFKLKRQFTHGTKAGGHDLPFTTLAGGNCVSASQIRRLLMSRWRTTMNVLSQ